MIRSFCAITWDRERRGSKSQFRFLWYWSSIHDDVKLIAKEIFDVNDLASVLRYNFNPLDATSSFRLKLSRVSINARRECAERIKKE